MTSTVDLFAPVRDRLASVETRLRQAITDQYPPLRAVTEGLLNAGGKRVRPAIALLTAHIFTADPEWAISLAAAVEMLHTATLVHDDLIDTASTRRGAPTINANWPPGASILTGDYLFACAADLSAQTNSVQVMSLFARTLMVIVNGEINQLFSRREETDRDAYFDRIYAKTAALFVLSAEAGAVLGTATSAQVEAMRQYGRQLGIAFQIVDDVLDYIGDPARTGKPVGGDLRQGLITLPAIHYRQARPGDPDLAALLDGRRGDKGLVNRVIRAVRQSGAIEQSLDKARQYATDAKNALDGLPDSPHRQALVALCDTVTNRRF